MGTKQVRSRTFGWTDCADQRADFEMLVKSFDLKREIKLKLYQMIFGGNLDKVKQQKQSGKTF